MLTVQQQEKEPCYISDLNDPQLVDKIITYYKLMKNDNEKSVDDFVNGMMKSVKDSRKDIVECFLVNEEDIDDMEPRIRIGNIDGIKRITSEFGQKTISQFIGINDYIKKNGFVEFCKHEELRATDSMLLNTVLSISCGIYEAYGDEIRKKTKLVALQKEMQRNLTLGHIVRNDSRFFVPRHQPYYKQTAFFHKKFEEFGKLYKEAGDDVCNKRIKGYTAMKKFYDIKKDFKKLRVVNTLFPVSKIMLKHPKFHEVLWDGMKPRFESLNRRWRSISRLYYNSHMLDLRLGDAMKELRHQWGSSDLHHRMNFMTRTMNKNWRRTKNESQYYYSDYYKTKQHANTIKHRAKIFGHDKEGGSFSMFPHSFNNTQYDIGGGGGEDDDEASGVCFTGLGPLDSNKFNVFKLSNYLVVIRGFFRWLFRQDCDELNCKYCFPKLPSSENGCVWIELCLLDSPFAWPTGFDPLDPQCDDYSNIVDWNVGFWYWLTNDLICAIITAAPQFSFLSFLLFEGGGVPLPVNLSICLSVCFVYGLTCLFWFGLGIILLAIFIFILRQWSIDEDLDMCKDMLRQLQENQIRIQRRLENELTTEIKNIKKTVQINQECTDERFELYLQAIQDLTKKLKIIEEAIKCLS